MYVLLHDLTLMGRALVTSSTWAHTHTHTYTHTHTHTQPFQVKYRIAVGLSKEGWAITRNLLTLAGMIIIGIATLNYAMKEFCIIALVGLMCDFFLQLVFFPTVLAIDLSRLEVRNRTLCIM